MASQETESVHSGPTQSGGIDAGAAPRILDAPKLAVPADFALERYKYILLQIHTVNDNLYRFLAIYQGLATTLIGGALALFVGYRTWGIASSTARGGVVGLL